MRRGLAIGLLVLLAACGENPSAGPSLAPVSQTPEPSVVPTQTPGASERATATAAAAQATFVAARASVTASAGRAATATASAVAALPTRTPTPVPLSTSQVAEIGRRGVVRIIAPPLGGSGAYIGRDSVITAKHVIEKATGISLFFDGKATGVGRLAAASPEHDLALLQLSGLEAAGASPLRWGDSNALRVGDELIVIGYPAIGLTVTRGILAGFKTIGPTQFLETDATSNPGNSGGPVLNSRGELVGVLVSGYRGDAVSGIQLSIASKIAKPFSESA